MEKKNWGQITGTFHVILDIIQLYCGGVLNVYWQD